MKIPMLDLGAQHAPIRKELLAAMEATLDSNRFILGPEVETLEKNIAAYCGTDGAIGVSSGSDALIVAMTALGVGPGDEVVTTPYSFFASVGCITRVGAVPRFVDIDPVTFNIDPGSIEAAITSKTKVIMPVHLYGQCADMEPILAIAKRHGVAVVEDAAQAIGAEYRDGRRAGSMGDLGCISFFPSKNLGTIGDGGAIVTSDEKLAKLCKVLRMHGAEPKYYHKLVGGNFRIDALHAAILNVKLPHLDAWTESRRTVAARYRSLLSERGLEKSAGIELPAAVYGETARGHVYNQFVLRVPDRDRLQKHLGEHGVASAIYYPVPLHLQECFAFLEHGTGDFPESERAANETLAIPMGPHLSEKEQQYIVDTIGEFYG